MTSIRSDNAYIPEDQPLKVEPKKLSSIQFLKKLDLDPKTLKRLAFISTVAVKNLPNNTYANQIVEEDVPSEGTSSGHTIERKVTKKDITTERLALISLRRNIIGLKEQTPSIEKQSFNDNYLLEVSYFEKEIQLLFGNDPKFIEKIQDLLDHIRDAYEETASNPLAKDNIESIQAIIATEIVQYTKRLAKANKEAIAAQTIGALVEGFEIKSVLNSASKTNEFVEDLRTLLLDNIPLRGVAVTKEDTELRREMYRSIKIVQEKTGHLLEIEQASKRSFLPFFKRSGPTKLEKKFQDLKVLADAYYKQFNFDDEEVEKFKDLSIEAHRPKRVHLINYTNDIFAGATNEANRLEQEAKDNLIKSYLKEKYKLPNTDIFSSIENREKLKNEFMRLDSLNVSTASTQKKIEETQNQIDQLKNSSKDKFNIIDAIEKYSEVKESPEKFNKMLQTIEETPELEQQLDAYYFKLGAVDEYRGNIERLDADAHQHTAIGNKNNLQENLASDMDTWKKQQKLAKKAIQGLFDELKVSYCDMANTINKADQITGTAAKSEITIKDARDILNKARTEVLKDKVRWDKPIVRNIEFSHGILPSQLLSDTPRNVVEHKMTCQNAGYPSSAPRDREAAPNTIQANLHRVALTDSKGEVLADYTSSATNVEFFRDGYNDKSESRKEATLQQTLEILQGKLDHKWNKLSPDEKETMGTEDNPLQIDVTVCNLLSPDTVRAWLMKNPSLGKKIGHISPTFEVDPSKEEHRILKESVEGWEAFDREEGQDRSEFEPFTYECKDGTLRTAEVYWDDKLGGLVCKFMVKDEDGNNREVFAQFDIACYNVGTNKWTKLMSDAKFGKGIEEIGGLIMKPMNTLRDITGKAPLTEYKGELGNEMQDEMNAKAFAKDTVRYHKKLAVLRDMQDALLDTLEPMEFSEAEEMLSLEDLKREIIQLKQEEIITPKIEDQLEAKLNKYNETIRKIELKKKANTLKQEIHLLKQNPDQDQTQIEMKEKELKQLIYQDKLRSCGFESVEKLIYGPKGIRELREKLLEAETKYHTAIDENSALEWNIKRKTAFQEWQTKREDLAKLLDQEINLKSSSHIPEEIDLLKLINHEENLNDIYNEVSDLLTFKEYRKPEFMKQNMYLLPSAIVALGCELDADPHTGCRSGKDRTSLQRMEVAVRFLLKKAFGRHLNFREQESKSLTYEIREQMILNSGHIDKLASLNIGSVGLNLTGGFGAYLKRFGKKMSQFVPRYQYTVLLGTKNVFSMNLK